jgi:hypothetical protein
MSNILTDVNVGGDMGMAAAWGFIAVSGINIIVALLMILLIRYMTNHGSLKSNMYVSMVKSMMIYQIGNDIGIILYTFVTPTIFRKIHGKFILCFLGFFGSSVSIWCFYILLVVWYTTFYLCDSSNSHSSSTSDIKNNQGSILVAMHIVCIMVAGLVGANMARNYEVISHVFQVYEIFRLSLSGITLLITSTIIWKLLKTTTQKSRHNSPLYRLIRKLIYYPVGSALLRIVSVGYDWIYHIDIYNIPLHPNFGYLLTLWIAVAFIPSNAILDLWIFSRVTSGSQSLLEMLGLSKEKKIPIQNIENNQEIQISSFDESNNITEQNEEEYYSSARYSIYLDSLAEDELLDEIQRRSLRPSSVNTTSSRIVSVGQFNREAGTVLNPVNTEL